MPGNNRESATSGGSSLTICRLDTGPESQFPRDAKARNYGYPIAMHRWSKLEIKNSEFIRACPSAALPLNATQMLIFGGSSTKCFILDKTSINNNQAQVQMTNTVMSSETHFGVINVHYSSHSDNNYYAINADKRVLYHLDTKTLAWQSRALRELGIDLLNTQN